VLFVPAKSPPHKLNDLHASYEDRMRMVELACAADARFESSRVEDRPGRSYSFDTVVLMREQCREPARWFFLIGADAFAEIRSWHRWAELIKLVEFIVVSRPRRAFNVPEGAQVHRLDTLELPVSRRRSGRAWSAEKPRSPYPRLCGNTSMRRGCIGQHSRRGKMLLMDNFREFEAGPDPFGRTYQVMFKWLQTAISIRHADTVDVQFLVVDGSKVIKRTVAMQDLDLKTHAKKTGRPMDDAWCARPCGAAPEVHDRDGRGLR